MFLSFACSFVRFPFDSYNPIGYLITIILEYIIYGYELFVIACTVTIGIGAFLFAMSVAEEIQSILHSINAEIQANENISSDELKTLFIEYIDVHANVKQLSTNIFNIPKS